LLITNAKFFKDLLKKPAFFPKILFASPLCIIYFIAAARSIIIHLHLAASYTMHYGLFQQTLILIPADSPGWSKPEMYRDTDPQPSSSFC